MIVIISLYLFLNLIDNWKDVFKYIVDEIGFWEMKIIFDGVQYTKADTKNKINAF